jgi:formylglycine-generating enzyme required for sulfatase activity
MIERDGTSSVEAACFIDAPVTSAQPVVTDVCQLEQDITLGSAHPSDWLRDDGAQRVFRGGIWYCYTRHCRSAFRYRNEPDLREYGLGFRPVFRLKA